MQPPHHTFCLRHQLHAPAGLTGLIYSTTWTSRLGPNTANNRRAVSFNHVAARILQYHSSRKCDIQRSKVCPSPSCKVTIGFGFRVYGTSMARNGMSRCAMCPVRLSTHTYLGTKHVCPGRSATSYPCSGWDAPLSVTFCWLLSRKGMRQHVTAFGGEPPLWQRSHSRQNCSPIYTPYNSVQDLYKTLTTLK